MKMKKAAETIFKNIKTILGDERMQNVLERVFADEQEN